MNNIRAVITVLTLGVVLCLVGSALLFAKLNGAITENRQTLCGAARIVSFNPVAQLPGETRDRFKKRQAAYATFLQLAEGLDCDVILRDAGAGESKKERLDAARTEAREVVDGGGNNPSGQPGPDPGPTSNPVGDPSPGGNPTLSPIDQAIRDVQNTLDQVTGQTNLPPVAP